MISDTIWATICNRFDYVSVQLCGTSEQETPVPDLLGGLVAAGSSLPDIQLRPVWACHGQHHGFQAPQAVALGS